MDAANTFNRVDGVRTALRQRSARWAHPDFIVRLLLIGLLLILIALPLAQLAFTTVRTQGFDVWTEVLTGRIAPNLLWTPLLNSLMVGGLVSLGTLLVGSFMAWLVMMTDVPGRRTLGLLASIPFILPSFAIALAWETLFRNDLVGGRTGFLFELGFQIPNWLSWGPVPIVLTLVAHYYTTPFLLISAALATINTELVEAGEMTGASRFHVLRGITLPLVFPAILSAGMLTFAEGVSNFTSPALLGLPVRFQTLSTRIYGLVNNGQLERAYVLTIILIVIAAFLLLVNSYIIRRRGTFATITGKAGRRRRTQLGKWRPAAFAAGFLIVFTTAIVPLIVLIASSMTVRTNSLTSGFSLHYWIGESTANIAQGQAGVLNNPLILQAAATTITFAIATAITGTIFGILIGYATRGIPTRSKSAIAILSFIPFFIPGVAFGAMYVAQFGRSFGPIPALYGTFTLLVLAGFAKTLPFSSQSGRAVFSQIAGEIDEAAVLAGARFPRRLFAIFVPLTIRGLIAGAVLVFVKMVRDLSLVVLLVTPTTFTLSMLAFRYASEGFGQFANAITVIIALIAISVTWLANRLQGASQPWSE
ncbi:iron ABC transporter permease [Kamptonema cortianum]|nr:iron ABC transporter permease [Oscillatoria laete-virens]MDK3158183.1 iron ABC transporter permease [Kamptonema cortianum]MDL5054949.1 iron ABC transporter permease [Oscillatoria laete-virens NRMC-F 0139]